MARAYNYWTRQSVWELYLFCMALRPLYIHEENMHKEQVVNQVVDRVGDRVSDRVGDRVKG